MSDIGPVIPQPPLPVTPSTQPATTTPAPAGTVPPPAAPPPDSGQTGGQPTGGQQGGQQPATPNPQGASATPSTTTPATTTPATTTPAQQTPAQQGTTPQPSSGQAAAPQAGAATQISDSLRELAQGGAFTAQAVARDGAALLVRTAAGTTLSLTGLSLTGLSSGGLASLLAQSDTALLTAALRLQLNPENPQQATVTAVNGTALQPPVAASAQPPTAAQLAIAISPPQPGGNAAAALPNPGQALTATVVPQPLQAGTSQALTPLPPGSQLQLVVQSATPPAVTSAAVTAPASLPQPAVPAQNPTQSPVQAAATPSAAQIAQQAIHAAATRPSPTSPPTGLAQTAVTAIPVATQEAVPSLAQLAAQPAANAAAASPSPLQAALPNATAAATLLPGQAGTPTVLSGIITGQNQAGQTLLNTPQGLLALSLPQALPPGAQVTLELAALVRPAPPPAAALGPVPLAGVLSRLQGQWPVLQQTLDAIRAADPALAQRLQDQLLPQPNARLAATALQFMAAAAAGNAQAWLGSEAIRKLEQQGKGDLLRKLDEDFRDLGRLNQRQGDNQWQALAMPMFIGGRVEAIQIFMRRRRDPKRRQTQTRFLIDFNLESTGPIQFDGFISVKQLDLILRSESDFGPAFRLDVTAIFEEAIALTGMTGSIRFHGREKPLDWPSPELAVSGPTTELKA